MKVRKYRKKPVVIEAVIWDGTIETFNELKRWIGSSFIYDIKGTTKPGIKTREGTMLLSQGDFVIKGIKGEFYPCKPGIFKDSYEPVK